MLIDDLYFKFIKTNDNITYSIDMLRIKTYITYFDFKNLEIFLNTYYKSKIKKFWCSDRPMCFHYNYLIEVGEGKTFYFCFMHNSESVSFNKDCKEYNFTIEFNPNKIKNDFILLHILKGFSNWFLRSFDIAMDFPVSILDIIFDIGNRRRLVLNSYGLDDLSYSIGQGDGRYKIYNKKKESKLSIPGELTRVEVSFEYDDFPLLNSVLLRIEENYLPNIYLNQYVVSLSDVVHSDATLNAVLYAVQHGFPIKSLSRVYKQKIKKMLEGGSKIIFDKNIIKQVFNECIETYSLNM